VLVEVDVVDVVVDGTALVDVLLGGTVLVVVDELVLDDVLDGGRDVMRCQVGSVSAPVPGNPVTPVPSAFITTMS